jgi:hypothetical protein
MVETFKWKSESEIGKENNEMDWAKKKKEKESFPKMFSNL